MQGSASSRSGNASVYREDIDRLRGFAVLSVIAFHFDAPGVHGGYVGVDIFFVISGFLITGILQREIAAGSFTFAHFYERRVRRLLPALYVVLLVSVIPALVLLLRSERHDFFQSIMATVTFTSNVLFWSQSGYFDRAALDKPLLHTWSLAVEEQFYLVLPALIWAVIALASKTRHRTIALPAMLATAMLTSFAGGLWFIRHGDIASAFYLSPLRAWEFLIGGLVAIEGFPAPRNRSDRLIAAGISYVLMLVPVFGLRPASLFPGWNALAPCLGATLFIWSGTGAPDVVRHRWSPFRLARFFGAISYSMYLWHWPLITFARFTKDGLTLNGGERALLFIVTVALSWLSWAFVERPFRSRQWLATRRQAFATALASSLGLIAICAVATWWPVGTSDFDRLEARLDAYNHFSEASVYRGACFRITNEPIDEAECLTMDPHKLNVLLWGDSHAAHYYPGLSDLARNKPINILQATHAGCRPSFSQIQGGSTLCRPFTDFTARWLQSHRPDVVIFSADWMGDIFSSRFDGLISDIRATAATLNEKGMRVVVLGPAVQFKTSLPSLLIRAMSRNIDPLPARDMVRPDIFAGDARMKAALPDTALFKYVSVIDAVCPHAQCPLMVDEGVPLVWDYGHLTAQGSQYVIRRLADQLGLDGAGAAR